MPQEMKTVCVVHTEDFRSLHKTYELQSGGDLGESVDLLLCDPLYNVCRQNDNQNSDHDEFNQKDIEVFCNFVEYVLNRGGHVHIFYPVVKFASW